MSDQPQKLATGVGIPTGEGGSRRQRHCPGSTLRVTRDGFQAMRREGHVWSSAVTDIPFNGLGDARTLCHADVAEIRTRDYERAPGEWVVAVTYAGLCAGCSADERDNRATLASRQGQPR